MLVDKVMVSVSNQNSGLWLCAPEKEMHCTLWNAPLI